MAVTHENVETVLIGPAANLHARLSWGAIIAGWLVATAVAGLLYVAGMALGFAAFDPWSAGGSLKGIGVGTGIWLIATWAAGLFIGGMFASWFDGKVDQTLGAMHGVAVWGLSVTAAAVWLSLGMGQLAHHRGPMGHGDAMSAAAASDNEALLVLQANVARMTSDTSGQGRMRGGDRHDKAVVAAILANHTDTARALLMADGVSSGDIDQTLPRLSNEAAAANTQLKADANRAARYTSIALWVAFLSGLLALLAAAAGGWAGAGSVHRVYHLRRYEGRPYREI